MLRIRLGLQEIDTTSKDVGAELKMYERTLLTTGIIIISTPASAIVLRIASINLFPKFAHWFPWIIQQSLRVANMWSTVTNDSIDGHHL